MEKNLTIALLDEIVQHCETIKGLQNNEDKHYDLVEILKKNYNVNRAEIEDFLLQIKDKVKKDIDSKQLERLNEKIVSMCKLVNISYIEKDSDKLNYSKIRKRVSNMRHSVLKRKKQ